ncbi:YmfL family putative regulatory protein [Vibrio furnissii]|uniref:YmfL family putative regulatory protein n=1 Tax=Vibrio furnissii TaxID=29494 RepID=UPI0020C1956A|nr:YmfL family putative regulatory protein [Vibrio furnissii]
MLAIFESKKEVVKEIIKHTKGGRGALAGAIGMSETTFNNKLYERNGCLFFDDEDLEAMELHAGTYVLAQYRASLRGGLFIPLGDFELDQEELSEIQIGEMASIGDVNVIISKALDDGEIDENEAKQIRKAAISAAAKFITSKLATIKVYKAS